MKSKQKKPHSYSIFIVPEGRPTSRRLTVYRWMPKALVIIGLLWVGATLALASAALYYRSGFLSTADVRSQNEEMKLATSRVEEKLVSMQSSVSRAQRLATTLETVAGISKKVMIKGIGPISEDDELPAANNVKLFQSGRVATEENPSITFEDLELKMDGLDKVISSVEMRLQEVYEFHQGKLAYWASIPSIWPVKGWITSEFGIRRRPKGIGSRFHEGMDIAASIGTPVYASGDGVVTFAGTKHGLGKCVVIDHGFGVSTVYGHNAELFVKDGDKVRRGANIATVGRTGRTTGPHLHYQVEVDGVPVDPMRYIIENF